MNGERTPGKVVIFSTCYVNYSEPGIGHDLIKLLRHNGIAYTLVEKASCCGMPKLELGDLDGVARHKVRRRTSRCWRALRVRAMQSSQRSRRAR